MGMRVQRDDMLASVLLEEMFEANRDDTRQHPSVTDLIYCLTSKYHNMTDRRLPPVDKTKMYMLLGLGLEKALIETRQLGVNTVGEYEGIHFHIDSLYDDQLLELKTTRIGPSKMPEGFSDTWLKQIMAYCKVKGTLTCSLAIVHIIQAELQVWNLEFEQEEVDENWAWLIRRKAIWDQFVGMGQAPTPFRYNQDWECKDCVYKLVCDARVAIDRIQGKEVMQ